MEHELDKLYDEWYEVILEVPVLMNQPTEKSTFLVNDVSTVRIVITFYTGEFLGSSSFPSVLYDVQNLTIINI